MTPDVRIASGVVKRSGKPPRFPAEYGAYLERLAKNAGIDRDRLATLTGLDYNTIYRNLTGKPQRSMLAANKIREALRTRGIPVDPVPGEGDGWIDPEHRAPEAKRTELPREVEIFRRNLVAFRVERGLDLHAAAEATGIALDMLRAYELGEEAVSGMHLLELARVYDRPPGHFELEQPPSRDRKAPPTVHARVVGSIDDMTPENRARVLELQRELAEINAAERARQDAAHSRKPKR